MDYLKTQKILDRITYGLYAICSHSKGKLNGQISNAVIQVTSYPPRIAVCINKSELTHEYIKESKTFSLCILSEDVPMTTIGILGYRSGRDIDKFSHIEYKLGKYGNPILLKNCIGAVEAKVIKEVDAGSHTLFIGEVVNSEEVSDGNPLTYRDFREVKGGKAPKNAPTYRFSEKELKEKSAISYICKKCGYIYNPAKGDPDAGITPGTLFENLPSDWVCPLCGNSKENFKQTG